MNVTSAHPRAARTFSALLIAVAVALGSLLGAAPALAAAGPSLTVTTAPAAGGIVTVTGSGFAAATPGVYVGVGAAGAAGFYGASAADTVWVAPGNVDGATGAGRTAPLAVDGTFTITLTVPAPSEAVPAYAVYASKAHGQGMADLSQNANASISFAAPAPIEPPAPVEPPVPAPAPLPAVSVSKTSGLNPDGETVTVTGTGFAAAAHPTAVGVRPPLAGAFAGIYVAFGSYLDAWKPSENVAATARVNSAAVMWLVSPEDVAAIGGAARGGVALAADGSFSLELSVAEFDKALAAGNYGVYTYAGSGAKYAPFETYTPVSFSAPEVVVPPAPLAPAAPAAAEPVAAGSLVWGVKSSFRSYITGPTAHGSITASGVGTSGGAYVFGQGAGGSYTAESGVGESNYTGTVRFTGHGGVLDVSLANPVIAVTSPGTATLSVTSGGSRVAVANLNLGAAAKSTRAGAVTYAGAPATLTAAGVAVFADFYPAGTALDPVTFTIGSISSAGGGRAVTLASFVAPASAPPATPPATTGITLSPGTPLVAGGQVTITADGFRPSETGISVVIYSEPTVLDRTATADANGRVTWTGTLPEGLTGTHTLTLQGSVDRGVVLEIPTALSAVLTGCTVTDAELVWGYKESFRSYISGSIAHGEWTVADGAAYETPNFIWSAGSGTVDGETTAGGIAFPGTVTFTGHGGVLNTVLTNLRVEFVGDESAFIVLDISGSTQDGTAVDQKDVRFVELDLTAGTPEAVDGEITFADVPTALTEAGSAAFGTYEAGTEFDPVTLTLAVDPSCSAVAADDAETTAVAPTEAPDAGADSGWILWVVVALALAAAAIAATMVIRRRRARA